MAHGPGQTQAHMGKGLGPGLGPDLGPNQSTSWTDGPPQGWISTHWGPSTHLIQTSHII